MRLIDTHTHLYLDTFRQDADEVIRRAQLVGVDRFYLPGIDRSVIPDMLALEARHPGVCHAMMGLHPCSVGVGYREELAAVERWLGERPFAAVGEIGLDFHWDLTHREEQYDAFRVQIGFAKRLGIPIVVHSRKSTDECISVVEALQDGTLKGVFHCFSGTPGQAKALVDLGMYLGIGGVSTYRNGGLEPVIAELGLSHVVLETDAPYLSPVPHRGRRNEPAYLAFVVERLCALTGLDAERVADITTANAEALFG